MATYNIFSALVITNYFDCSLSSIVIKAKSCRLEISLSLDPYMQLCLSQRHYLQFISSGFIAFWIKSSILVATEFVQTLLPSANAVHPDFLRQLLEIWVLVLQWNLYITISISAFHCSYGQDRPSSRILNNNVSKRTLYPIVHLECK